MAWLATYGAGNKVDEEVRSYSEPYTNLIGGTSLSRTVTTTKYKYVGMTAAAAATCQAALNDPGSGVLAVAKKSGAGGNWMVEVTEITKSAWS